jgi:hypothetical protein
VLARGGPGVPAALLKRASSSKGLPLGAAADAAARGEPMDLEELEGQVAAAAAAAAAATAALAQVGGPLALRALRGLADRAAAGRLVRRLLRQRLR